jgi:putative transposase
LTLRSISRYPARCSPRARDARLAEQLLADTIVKQGVGHGQLTVHADRGSSMASKPVALLLADLGVTKSHSRPHVSKDNPFSESQFKTMKYRPHFPDRFGSIEDAPAFCRPFFAWYKAVHRHSGIGLMTPSDVHYGRAPEVIRAVSKSSTAPGEPTPGAVCPQAPPSSELPSAAWINRPDNLKETTQWDPSRVASERLTGSAGVAQIAVAGALVDVGGPG